MFKKLRAIFFVKSSNYSIYYKFTAFDSPFSHAEFDHKLDSTKYSYP